MESIQDICKEVYTCSKPCGGCSKHGFPGYFGPKFKGVLFVGQCPGYAKSPFYGHSKIIWDYYSGDMPIEAFNQLYIDEWLANAHIGVFFNLLFKHFGLTREEFAFTNLVKCPFTNNNFKAESINTCRGYLDRQIMALKPKVVVAMGRFCINHFRENANMKTAFDVKQIDADGNIAEYKVVTFPHPSRLMDKEDCAKELAQMVKQALSQP
jgi:uracil-DNA glycosylase family 4